MFKRGKRVYRRAYYLGPDGGAYFYDEDIPDGDPSLAAMGTADLPTCPIDADDCQGFIDPVANIRVLGSEFLGEWGNNNCGPSSMRSVFVNNNGRISYGIGGVGNIEPMNVVSFEELGDPRHIRLQVEDPNAGLSTSIYVKERGYIKLLELQDATSGLIIENGRFVSNGSESLPLLNCGAVTQ